MAREVSADMIMGVINAVQHVRVLETAIYRIAFPRKGDPPTTRTPQVLYLHKQIHLLTSQMRRIGLEDVLVGTSITRNASEELLKILEFCFLKGSWEHVRLGMHESVATALVLRSQNMEYVDLNYMFKTTLGDPSCSALSHHVALALLIDKSKTMRIGHKFVSGCVHHLHPIRDAIFWVALYLFMSWTPVEKGGLGGDHPNLADPAQWFGTPLLRERKDINNKTRMRPESTLKAIKSALRDPNCLNLSQEEEAGFHKRHGPRHNAVSILKDGGVDASNQNGLGRWETDKRTQNYPWYKLARQAVLTMAGTPKNDFGSQSHNPSWNLAEVSESIKTKADPIASEWNKFILNPETYHLWKDKKGNQSSGPSISSRAFNDVSSFFPIIVGIQVIALLHYQIETNVVMILCRTLFPS